MRFLLDENIGKKVANFLIAQGYPALRIREIHPGLEDYQILELAVSRNLILITSDKDFGELIFKEKQTHRGVIFLRLRDQKSGNKIKALRAILVRYKEIGSGFVVVAEREGKFKFRRR